MENVRPNIAEVAAGEARNWKIKMEDWFNRNEEGVGMFFDSVMIAF